MVPCPASPLLFPHLSLPASLFFSSAGVPYLVVTIGRAPRGQRPADGKVDVRLRVGQAGVGAAVGGPPGGADGDVQGREAELSITREKRVS